MTVQDRGAWAGLAALVATGPNVELVMDALQRAVPRPKEKIAVDCAAWWEAVGQAAPLAAVLQNIQNPGEDGTKINFTVPASGFPRRNQRRQALPLCIGQIAGKAQFTTIIQSASLRVPHLKPPIPRPIEP